MSDQWHQILDHDTRELVWVHSTTGARQAARPTPQPQMEDLEEQFLRQRLAALSGGPSRPTPPAPVARAVLPVAPADDEQLLAEMLEELAVRPRGRAGARAGQDEVRLGAEQAAAEDAETAELEARMQRLFGPARGTGPVAVESRGQPVVEPVAAQEQVELWCEICNEDAVLRCTAAECEGDVFCARCFQEVHEEPGMEGHKPEPCVKFSSRVPKEKD